jgi:transposase
LRCRFDQAGVAQVSAPAQAVRRWRLCGAKAGEPVEIEIVKRTDKDGGFKLIRRRWVIERTFSWLRRNRRLMAHYEALAMTAARFVKLAMISVMLKRLTGA